MRFEVEFLKEASEFIDKLESKTRTKVLYNIRKSQEVRDAQLFKKLTDFVWEFRTRYNKKTIRLLAFWYKTGETNVLVICTHGFIKKTNNTPKKEIKKTEQIRKEYLNL